jgi:hypothetical protein
MAWNIDELDNRVVNKIPEIGICIPHTGSVSMFWIERAYGPIRYETLTWCNKTPFLSSGPPIHLSREALVDLCLERGMDYIFFLDSDVSPRTPDNINLALYLLYNLQLPIVSGLYYAKKKGTPTWAAWVKGTPEPDPRSKKKIWRKGYLPVYDITANRLFKADVAGLGFCLIHRRVFETIPKPWFSWSTRTGYSEDFYFFRKAKKYGFDLVMRSDVRCDHLAQYVIAGDVEPRFILPAEVLTGEAPQ